MEPGRTGWSMTLAEMIADRTATHLDNGGLLFGQCLTAVGWVAGTVPKRNICEPKLVHRYPEGGIVELPTSDVAGPAFVVGAALAGRRPIFVCRYQGFMSYNLTTIANYAAKSKAMWGVPCPMFVRAIGMEGGIGPVATGCHHSAAVRFPGIKVVAPMTPLEWRDVWNDFLVNDEVVYCSEHRLSYRESDEDPDRLDWTPIDVYKRYLLIGISAGRYACREAASILGSRPGVVASTVGLVNIKPFEPWNDLLSYAAFSDAIIVVDSDYEDCGAAQYVAQRLSRMVRKRVLSIGVEDRVAGFATHLDVRTPTASDIIHRLSEADRG